VDRLIAVLKLSHDLERLASYPFYHAALGQFRILAGQFDGAREHFAAALALARNPMERSFFAQKIDACG